MTVGGASGGFWHSLRRLPDRTPLRIKMITAVLTLVVIALAVISIAGISVLRSYLLDQYDSQLQRYATQAPAEAVAPYLAGAQLRPVPGAAVDWVQQGNSKVQQVVQPGTGFGRESGKIAAEMSPGPAVSATAGWVTAARGEPLTVGAASGDGRWRVLAYPHQFADAAGDVVTGTVIVGVDVSNVYSTLGRLTAIDLLVSAIVIVGLAVVGVAVVRASLRPLSDIEQTAEAIAAGDLTRRVPDLDPRTEVGRLGRSLNAMLSQIETAFRAQARSEAAARRSEERMRQFVADASHELRTPLTAIRGFAEYYRQRGGVESGSGSGAGQADGPAAAESGPAAGTSPGTGQAPVGTEPASSAPAASDPAASNPAASNPADSDAADSDAAAGHPAGNDAASDESAGAGGQPAGFAALAGNGNGLSQLAPQDLDRIMRRVEQESARMGVLVEDMLLLARLDQQRPLDRHPVDLLTLAADAVHDARVVAPSRSINLTVGAGAALLVLGDEVRLRQVIGNLMSNALAHTPDGTPIDVRIRSGSLDEARTAGVAAPPGPPPAQIPAPPQPPLSSAAPRPAAASAAAPGPAAAGQPPQLPLSRSAAVLEVTDHGPGLSREQAEHAFERFYRADQARTTGGTGLGLAIVAALVAAHGGAVWVESAPGAGATFRIALPLAPEALHPDDDHPDDDQLPDGELEHPEPEHDGPGGAGPGPGAGPQDDAEPGPGSASGSGAAGPADGGAGPAAQFTRW